MKKYEIDLSFASILQYYFTPIMHIFPHSAFPVTPVI